MFETLRSLAAPAAMQRLTLLANHLLSSEPLAAARLQPHTGRRVHLSVTGWPAWLPAWPQLDFRVTPAGLLEWVGEAGSGGVVYAADADLRVIAEVGNPAVALLQGLAGHRPRVEIAGDAAFAADVDWLFENLRWDIEDDLAKVVGAVPARELSRVAGWLGRGIREAARLAARAVPGAEPTPRPSDIFDRR